MNRIKLLSTYFPYGLKGEVVTIPEEVTLTGIHNNSVVVVQDSQERKHLIQLHEFTPYLKPVSKITSEEMKKISELQKVAGLDYSGCSTMYDENTKLNYNQWALEPFYIVTQLLAWHYDIFGELEWWGIARENPNS